jgi:hypothetical protein
MIQRVTNPNHVSYKAYGGVGITVCDRWKDSFENFLMDKGPRPEGTTLGRILDMGNYNPETAFWMSPAEQGLARRNKNALLKWAAQGGEIACQ